MSTTDRELDEFTIEIDEQQFDELMAKATGDMTEAPLPPTPAPVLGEVGLTGLKRYGGYVNEEFLQQLTGWKGARVFREMKDNDPVIGAFLFAVDKILRQVKWSVESKGNDATAKFVEECMNDMSQPWADTIGEFMSMLPFGWSFHEIVYKRRRGFSLKNPSSKYDDGKIGWRKLPIRAQESLLRWDFNENGEILSLVQLPAPDYRQRVIPMTRGLLFRAGLNKDNPEGRSVIRNAYRPWYFKKRIEEIEGIGIERDLAGFPVMYVDPDLMSASAPPEKQEVLQAYKDIVTNIRRDQQEGLLLPSVYNAEGHKLYELDLLSAGGTRQFDTSTIIERYNRLIAMTVLADFILLGHESVGSFALSSDKSRIFAMALGNWLDIIRDVFNSYAVPRLLSINGMPLDSIPEIKYGDIESPDLNELGTYVQQLASAGMNLFPDKELENVLRQAASWPEREEPLEPVVPAGLNPVIPGGGPPEVQPAPKPPGSASPAAPNQ